MTTIGTKVNNTAIDFELKNQNGENIKLSHFKGREIVLYFYPKDDTPGCTQEACEFGLVFDDKKYLIIGVSPDSVASHLKFAKKYNLPFILLSDENHEVCEKYGVWKEKSMYGRKYMGVERTTIVINKEFKISKVYEKVKVAGHASEVVASI